MQMDLRAVEKKVEELKKENLKWKKQGKEYDCKMNEYQHKVDKNEEIMLQIMQCEQNYSKIINDFSKYKEDETRKTAVYEKIIEMLK